MDKKNKVTVATGETQKGKPLAQKIAGKSLLTTLVVTLGSVILGNWLGRGLQAGTMSGKTGILLTLVFCALVSLVVYFISRWGFRKVGISFTKVAEQFANISRGNLSVEQVDGNILELTLLGESLRNISEGLRTYMADFEGALIRITQSELDFQMDHEYEGEFARMKGTINGILTFLNDIMHHIESVSGQVENIAGQITSSSQNLAQGATEQAGAVEELLSTVNEISNQVGQTANATSNANEKADMVRKQVTTSNEHMTYLTDAMGEISNYSKQVEKIVKIIEDIAFQTNILALNAAVEAARAGVNGRSFAVVADEVKSLATKSASAAADTTNLIRNTITAVEKGMDISTQTAELLHGVVNSVDEVANIVSDISAATAHENISIQQVVQGLDQVSVVVQTNSATAEEHAAVSHELADQANNLQRLVSSFKLR